ncbi:MAG: hypothetical protein AABZ01_14475 [Gemmatimonadota bacterium]
MYSTCLFCHGPLGANQVVETFPVGRRLAFDQARGRLWVVCRKCERWNLTPFEERWDAIEYCERRFRDARKRVVTDNIGLARLDEGLELVRIGEPMRPEFAAWRYGDQFGRRRKKNMITTGAVVGVGAGLVLAVDLTGVLSGTSYMIWQGWEGIVKSVKGRRLVARVPLPGGDRVVVRGRHAIKARIEVPQEADEGLRLVLPYEKGIITLTGYSARRATALIMPSINEAGGKEKIVKTAVERLESAGHPDELLRRVAVTANTLMFTKKGKPKPKGVLQQLRHEDRLAIEMAVNEENERHALEGELALLELEWRDAEEIAGIADTLGVPESVEQQLDELRLRAGAQTPDGNRLPDDPA